MPSRAGNSKWITDACGKATGLTCFFHRLSMMAQYTLRLASTPVGVPSLRIFQTWKKL